MHVYTHTGWAHRQRISATFLTRKNSCAPDGVQMSGHPLDLETDTTN